MTRTRMSDTEALMWTVEKDPSLRSDFLNITVLEGPPDHERLRAKITEAVALLPRLRQKVVSAPLRLAPPEWVEDPQFDLGYHVRRVALPEPGGTRELLDFAAGVAMAPFDRARPLWEFTVVEGLEGGRAALLQKIHHTVTDGVGGLKLSLALLDLEADPAAGTGNLAGEPPGDADAPESAAPSTPVDVLVETLMYVARRQADGLRRAIDAVSAVARHPGTVPSALATTARTARSLQQQALVRGNALSPIMIERSLSRRFEIHTVSLHALKAVAKKADATINDAFVTGVAGAMGRYHERMGAPVDELRMAMPVNLRVRGEDASGGNRFAPARIVVPVQPKDPGELLEAVADRLSDIRTEPALGMAESVAGVVGMLPTSVLVPVTKAQTRTIDFATSNLRGSPVELFLAGRRIEGNYPFGPCTGCAVNVTVLSYGGDFDMGVNLDPAALTDPGAFMECLAESFDALLGLGP
ncbi:MAG TPA: wax ester/triacylglycerol synthase family O-acyltransferase [Acidimicrobiia bacterium]|nr:wax ester/triacylglycerol synthase family O-acyltransferase [Acidimicrobiia bacterium]